MVISFNVDRIGFLCCLSSNCLKHAAGLAAYWICRVKRLACCLYSRVVAVSTWRLHFIQQEKIKNHHKFK